jgi:hypothetical protein
MGLKEGLEWAGGAWHGGNKYLVFVIPRQSAVVFVQSAQQAS